MPRPSRVAPAAVAVAAAIAVGGCSFSTTEIDSGQAEKFVEGAFAKPPRSVSCPSGVEAKKGGTFTCRAVASDGTHYVVTLHMADDKGRVTIGKGDAKPVGKRPPLGTPPPLG